MIRVEVSLLFVPSEFFACVDDGQAIEKVGIPSVFVEFVFHKCPRGGTPECLRATMRVGVG